MAHQHDLQPAWIVRRLGQITNLLKQIDRQTLGIVNEHDRECLERRERSQEIAHREDERIARRALDAVAGLDHAEAGQHRRQQLLARRERTADKRRHGSAVELLHHRATESRFARTDFCREDRDWLVTPNRGEELLRGLVVGGAVIQKLRVR